MHYVSENCIHSRSTPPSRRSSLVPVATRDDLVRFVVGMQWREAMMSLCVIADAGYVNADGDVDDVVSMSSGFDDVHRPAVDIVDEWLGVR